MGGAFLQADMDQRAEKLAVYMIENRATVRAAAKQFGISKSTVHKDLTTRLPRVSASLFAAVRELVDQNRAERHIRGGLATKQKYSRRRSE